jgi:hypothetical protein
MIYRAEEWLSNISQICNIQNKVKEGQVMAKKIVEGLEIFQYTQNRAKCKRLRCADTTTPTLKGP